MKSKNYYLLLSRKLIMLIAFQFSVLALSQTSPDVSRLVQQNTLKGSRLLLVETTDNFAYHLGTINSSEVGFDNLFANNVGLDDLFILKSNASTGNNVWFKTFNATSQGVITPRYFYVDSAENMYVFAQFRGSVTVGSKTITSANATDAFLMKLDGNGNALWINYLPNGFDSLVKNKCVADGNDVFLVYGNGHLARFDAITGDVIYDNVYNGFQFKSVALSGTNVYLAGSTTNSGAVIGSESFPDAYAGFVLKGDKNGNFTQSLRVGRSNNNLVYSDVNDIAVTPDGLLVSGFYANNAINLITETGTVSFSYNPNTSYLSGRLYNYVAKTDLNLAGSGFFRSSSAINTEGSSALVFSRNFSRILSESNGTGFRHVMYINDRYKNITSFTNTNGTVTNVPSNSGTDYSLITLSDGSGAAKAGIQSLNFGLKTGISANYFIEASTDIRLFTSGQHNFTISNPVWSKQKNSSLGGSLSQVTIKHLKSATSDFFLTALAEGKADYFGTSVLNGTGSFSRYINRIGADGLAKWMAKVDGSMLTTYTLYNVSQNYTAVDSQDNFYVLLNLDPNGTPKLTDAIGMVISFNQRIYSDWRVLIKLDKDGKYLWSKEISGSEIAGISVDKNDNVYVTGVSGNLLVSGTNYNNSGNSGYYFLKFSNGGSLSYSKFYQNNSGAYSINSAFDNADNLYIFSEPLNRGGGAYVFGNVTIPSNESHTDLIMLKLDANGNAVFGKNFYANAVDYRYAWPNDVKFDGTDFILMGNYLGDSGNMPFTGLDLTQIPRTYSNNSPYVPFIAKINTAGGVIWQKSIDSNNGNTGNYTNIDLDENKNIYMFYYVKDKVSLNGLEYSFDSVKGNKVLLKLNTNGGLSYLKTIDYGASSFPMVDVIANDKLNISAFTLENSVLNYPIKNANASNLYIATLGALDQKYLTPKKDDRLLTLAAISNDPQNPNRFDFDLVSNVNWTASSDQPWLTISSLKLGAKNMQNTLSAYGDAALTALAAANNTGADRSANILISGDGTVAGKTVIVTQSGILGVAEASLKVIVLYPNPTSEILHVKTDQTINKIEIFDVSGRILKTVTGKTKAVRVADMEKGLYLIKIHTASNIINSKFIKN